MRHLLHSNNMQNFGSHSRLHSQSNAQLNDAGKATAEIEVQDQQDATYTEFFTEKKVKITHSQSDLSRNNRNVLKLKPLETQQSHLDLIKKGFNTKSSIPIFQDKLLVSNVNFFLDNQALKAHMIQN